MAAEPQSGFAFAMAAHPRIARNRVRSAAGPRAFRARLADLIVQLQLIESMVIVCAIALKWQRRDADPAVAGVLRHNILRRLDEQIRKAKSVRRLLSVSTALQ